MSLMDLQQLVKQELSSNPTLEVVQPEADAQIGGDGNSGYRKV